MAKRPSTPSIRARQRRILEYLFSVDKTFKSAAKDFGVTPRQLEKFATTDTRKLRSVINRSPAYQQLFSTGSEQSVKKKTKVQGKKYKRVQYEEAQIQVYRGTPGMPVSEVNSRVQYGEMIQRLYVGPKNRNDAKYLWAEWTSQNGLPVNYKTAKLLYRNKRISQRDWINYQATWQAIYGKELNYSQSA